MRKCIFVFILLTVGCGSSSLNNSHLKGGDIGDISFKKFDLMCHAKDFDHPYVVDIKEENSDGASSNEGPTVSVHILSLENGGGDGAGSIDELGHYNISEEEAGSGKFKISVDFAAGSVHTNGNLVDETESGYENLPGDLLFNADNSSVCLICDLLKKL